ncbi:MAG: UDP-2,3-diacylglucosamine diphosphatase LpxI [Methylobacteriaceae bacterium]|nr:UDP-2,3-diacylglucosamine diphosphatase LpxI [Methylobacteriaceae bacterium]
MTPESAQLTVLAGGGTLPLELADHLERSGIAFRMIAFREFASRALRAKADAVVPLLDLPAIKALLTRYETPGVSLVGQVHRPNAAALLSAYTLFRNYRYVKDVISKGDDNLLRGAVSILEEWGHSVVGVHELMPDIMAPRGVLGRRHPNEDDRRAIQTGFELIRALSPYDVGQAVALTGERVLAVEGPEGTDRMLDRVRVVQNRRLSFAKPVLRGALVKGPKKGQDLRVDMPAIGPKTVIKANKAGLNGVAVAAGFTLIIDRERTVAEADKLGLYLIGYDPEDNTPEQEP